MKFRFNRFIPIMSMRKMNSLFSPIYYYWFAKYIFKRSSTLTQMNSNSFQLRRICFRKTWAKSREPLSFKNWIDLLKIFSLKLLSICRQCFLFSLETISFVFRQTIYENIFHPSWINLNFWNEFLVVITYALVVKVIFYAETFQDTRIRKLNRFR